MGGPGLSSTWPESKIINKAEPKSNLGGLGLFDPRLGHSLKIGFTPRKMRELRKTCIAGGGGERKYR